MAFLLRGQWQVGLFCYVISNKLACFVMWSVISLPLFRDQGKFGLFVT